MQRPEMQHYYNFGSDMDGTVLMNSGEKGLRKYIKATNNQEAAHSRFGQLSDGDGSRAIEELKGSLQDSWNTSGCTHCNYSKVGRRLSQIYVIKFCALSGNCGAIVIIGILVAQSDHIP